MILIGLILCLAGSAIIWKKRYIIAKYHLAEEHYLTVVPFVLLSGVCFLILGIGLYYQLLEDAKTQYIAIMVTIILGVFSVLAYFVARKIEKSIRERIDSFAEFVERAYKVFEEPCARYRMMVIYPYFGLLNRVIKKVRDTAINLRVAPINDQISECVEDKKIDMLVGKNDVVERFLEQIGGDPDKNEEMIKLWFHNTNMIEHYKRQSEKVISCNFDNPLHMIISEKRAVWGSVGKAGECSGFYSNDRDIVHALKNLFDILFEKSKTQNEVSGEKNGV